MNIIQEMSALIFTHGVLFCDSPGTIIYGSGSLKIQMAFKTAYIIYNLMNIENEVHCFYISVPQRSISNNCIRKKTTT